MRRHQPRPQMGPRPRGHPLRPGDAVRVLGRVEKYRDKVQIDLYAAEPAKVKELAALLELYVSNGRSTPGPKQTNDVGVVWDRRRK